MDREPVASEDIAQGEADHNHKPEKAGSNKEHGELTILTRMHEKQDDEQGFGHCDADATTLLRAPRSINATQTVTPVRTRRAAKTV